MRRLIINADDFGLTPGINRAILEAHGHGIVTSATLMAQAPAFEEAVRMAQSAPGLSVGCHVVLVDGSPLLNAPQVSSLIAGKDGDGVRFRDGVAKFAFRTLCGRLDPEQIEAEATAQIRKLQSAGVAVSHLDTHKHTHALAAVLRPLLHAGRACGIRAVRNPFEPFRLRLLAGRPSLWTRWCELAALRILARNFRREVEQTGLIAPDGTVGIVVTGALDEQLFRLIVENLPQGTWEFVCHPGYNDVSLQNMRTRLRESRAKELRILTSTLTRDLLQRARIQLISYHELA